MCDPVTQFIPTHTELAANDLLNEYITHTGSAVFACPSRPARRRILGFDAAELIGAVVRRNPVTTIKSIALFVLAAVLEIGGAWLVWQGVREDRGWTWAGLGVIGLGAYGFIATLQPDAHFGRILAAYGGVFVAGSLLWGMTFDGFRPDRWDAIGTGICLVGVAVIMYAPRTN